jgi:hypothetical protein
MGNGSGVEANMYSLANLFVAETGGGFVALYVYLGEIKLVLKCVFSEQDIKGLNTDHFFPE